MVLIDTSVWVELFRDQTGERRAVLLELINGREVWLPRFSQLELLQGSRNEREWDQLSRYLASQDYLDPDAGTWVDAARIYFDLRRRGETVRSPIDCCIAQLALDHDILLMHCDRDFQRIAEIRPLRDQMLTWVA